MGKTPLLKMDIPTGDNPPITQRPYTLALKHVQWVQEEIEIEELFCCVYVTPSTSRSVAVLGIIYSLTVNERLE